MKVQTPVLGGVAQSIRGRDKGCFYVITQIDGAQLSLADGVKRKLTNPKKKNIRHVRLLPDSFGWTDSVKAFDTRVAYFLKSVRAKVNSEDASFV